MSVADLPEEILFSHILCRLPVKSILCFRSVCKAWNLMLREHQFVKLHLKNHQQQACNDKKKLLIRTTRVSNFFYDYRNEPEVSSYYFIDCNDEAVESRVAVSPLEIPVVLVSGIKQILGSCNGLVALIVENKKILTSTILILWNPSTGESKYLNDTYQTNTIDFGDLYGFGYDGDYKIIHIITSMYEECQVYIYSLKNNSWKEVKGVPNKCFLSVFCPTQMAGVELNGYIYWMVHPPYRPSEPFIAGFGLRDESLTFLGLPCDLLRENYCGYYYNIAHVGLKAMGRSCIAAFRFYMNDKFVVWTLKDPDKKENEWEKFITLSLSSPELKFTCSIRPLWFTKDGKVLLIIGFREGDKDQRQHNIGVYDPQKKRLGFVQIYGIKNISHVMPITEMGYIPSLVSPNMFKSGMHQVIDTKCVRLLTQKKRKQACPRYSR